MGNQRFSIIPATAVADTELTDSVFRTLAALGLYGDQHGWCWPSQSTLAEIRGVTRVTINSHIKQLAKLGYLNIHARYDDETGAQKSNAMQIRFDHEHLPPCKTQTLHPLSSPELDTPHKAQDFTHNAPENAPEKRESPRAIRVYENLMAPITVDMEAKVLTAVDTYGEQLVIEAIQTAVDNKARRWRYIETVLENWRIEGKGGKEGRVNGQHLKLWDSQALSYIQGKRPWPELDPAVQKTLRAMGGENLKRIKLGFETDQAKKQFLSLITETST